MDGASVAWMSVTDEKKETFHCQRLNLMQTAATTTTVEI